MHLTATHAVAAPAVHVHATDKISNERTTQQLHAQVVRLNYIGMAASNAKEEYLLTDGELEELDFVTINRQARAGPGAGPSPDSSKGPLPQSGEAFSWRAVIFCSSCCRSCSIRLQLWQAYRECAHQSGSSCSAGFVYWCLTAAAAAASTVALHAGAPAARPGATLCPTWSRQRGTSTAAWRGWGRRGQAR